jgi:hypothetical protein
MRINTSSLIPNQLPDFVRSDYPTFIAFVEAYYEYLDNQGVDLKSLRDLDTTIDSFIQYFKRELAINLPAEITVDERFLLQHIKDQYLAKGSEGSFKLLFRLLYNKNVTVNYPGRQMLRASDGRWQQDVSIFVNVTLGDPADIDGKLVDVIKPNKTFKLLIDRRQYVEVEIARVVQLSANTFEFFIDRKYFGEIEVGDEIRYKEIFVGKIVSTTSKLEISQAGEGFTPGQLFELKTGSGVRSIVKITRVGANGQILSAEFIKFGIGYATDFSLSVNATNDYYTSTNESLLTSTLISPGAVAITDVTRGFGEQGYINTVNYAYDIISGVVSPPWDGAYAGEVIREFTTQASQGVVVSSLQDAIFKVSLGSLAKYPGYYSTNDGFLDDAIYIQDSRFYQAFSYVLKLDERLDSYKTAVKTMVHPAGTALFGEFEVQNNFDISVELESLVKSLALQRTDSVTSVDSIATFAIEKALSEELVISQVLTQIISKALTDSVEPTDANWTHLTSKAVTSTLDTPTDTEWTHLTGKALATSLSTPTDSITTKDLTKALTDSSPILESLAQSTTKYLEDNSVGTITTEGYVALNPYSEGNYFAVTPIIYDNTIDATFDVE